MSDSSDPSLVDDATLRASLTRDLKAALEATEQHDWHSAAAWTSEARVTIVELSRRAALTRIRAAKGGE